MITSLPTKDNYNVIGKQCLNQAFKIIYDIDKELIQLEGIDYKEVWGYHLGDFSTSLILIHQAIESFMKAAICGVSPLLLLDLKRTEWPTLPDSTDKDFNELFTIGGEALIKTYCSVVDQEDISKSLTNYIEQIRLSRNKIVHGVTRDHLDPAYLLRLILGTYTIFLGKDSWWLAIRERHLSHPLFPIFDAAWEEATMYRSLNYVESLVNPVAFKSSFTVNLKARRYYCPSCNIALCEVDDRESSKWAFLIPQGIPKVNQITCLVCQRAHTVIRADCLNDRCKGDVQHQHPSGYLACLTCHWDH